MKSTYRLAALAAIALPTLALAGNWPTPVDPPVTPPPVVLPGTETPDTGGTPDTDPDTDPPPTHTTGCPEPATLTLGLLALGGGAILRRGK